MIELFPRLHAHLRRFGRESRAAAATEFAVLLPLMLIMYLGSIDVAQMVEVDRKTAQSTRTVADLTSQLKGACNSASTTAPSAITGIFKATTAVVAPYSTAPLGVVVSCLAIDPGGTATVVWSQGYQHAARATRSTFAAPAGFNDSTSTKPTYWVLGENSYNYTPLIGYVLTGTFKLSETVYMRARF
jgi:Flp pilus assembly protein TadG